MKKAVAQSHISVTNEQGEIKKQIMTSSSIYEAEPSYIKLYIEDISNLFKLPPSSSKIIIAFAKAINYNGQIIVTNYVKKQIANELGYKSTQVISNSLTTFLKKKLMRRVGTGAYVLNPHLFAKGAWRDIKKLRVEWLELNIQYTRDGKRIINNQLYNDKETKEKQEIQEEITINQ